LANYKLARMSTLLQSGEQLKAKPFFYNHIFLLSLNVGTIFKDTYKNKSVFYRTIAKINIHIC